MSIGFVVAASLRILDNCSADGCLKKASDLQEDWIFQPHCIHDSAPLEEKERVQRHTRSDEHDSVEDVSVLNHRSPPLK